MVKVGARHGAPAEFLHFCCWWFVRKCDDPRLRPREWIRGRPRWSAPEGAERSQPTASAVGPGRSSPGALKGAIQLLFEPDNRPQRPRSSGSTRNQRRSHLPELLVSHFQGCRFLVVSFPRLKPWAMISGPSGAAAGADPRVAFWRSRRSANAETSGPRHAEPLHRLECMTTMASRPSNA